MYLRNLYPAPKQCREDENRRFVFGDSVTARVRKDMAGAESEFLI